MSAQSTLKRPLSPSVDLSRPPGWHELLGTVGDSLYRAALAEGVRLESTVAGELIWRPSGNAADWLAKADQALRRFERELRGRDPKTTRGKAECYAEWADDIAAQHAAEGVAARATDIATRLRALKG